MTRTTLMLVGVIKKNILVWKLYDNIYVYITQFSMTELLVQ